MQRETILIVDDNGDEVETMRQILESMEYRILVSSDGRLGLQVAVDHRPDLIFMDTRMLTLDGLEMLTSLRRTDCVSPVTLITAHRSEQIAITVVRLGVHDYLNRPFTPEEVALAVDRGLRQKRLMQDREGLSHRLRTAETVRVAVITLAHYLNNYLTAVSGGLALLDEALRQDCGNAESLRLLGDCRRSSQNIEAVMRVMLRETRVTQTPYTDTTPMLDIQEALRKELAQLAEDRRK